MNALEFIRTVFADATDDEAETLLWAGTSFPCVPGGTGNVIRYLYTSLYRLGRRSAFHTDGAIAIAHRDWDVAMQPGRLYRMVDGKRVRVTKRTCKKYGWDE